MTPSRPPWLSQWAHKSSSQNLDCGVGIVGLSRVLVLFILFVPMLLTESVAEVFSLFEGDVEEAV